MNSANTQHRVSRGKGTSVLGLAILGTIFAAFLALAWNRCSQPALTDYEGVIVDRWAGFSTSDKGRAHFNLLVERDNGERITVNIDEETYHKAQIGRQIISRNGKIELIEAQAKPDK